MVQRRTRSRALTRRRRTMRGRGFWGKIQKFGNRANSWLKKSRFVSNSVKQYAPGLQGALAGELIRSFGYGRKRKVRVRRRRRRGGALRLAGAGCKKKRYRH